MVNNLTGLLSRKFFPSYLYKSVHLSGAVIEAILSRALAQGQFKRQKGAALNFQASVKSFMGGKATSNICLLTVYTDM